MHYTELGIRLKNDDYRNFIQKSLKKDKKSLIIIIPSLFNMRTYRCIDTLERSININKNLFCDVS